MLVGRKGDNGGTAGANLLYAGTGHAAGAAATLDAEAVHRAGLFDACRPKSATR